MHMPGTTYFLGGCALIRREEGKVAPRVAWLVKPERETALTETSNVLRPTRSHQRPHRRGHANAHSHTATQRHHASHTYR